MATTTSDAIIVGEGWISEHYFTTDARSESFRAEVVTRRKEWDRAAKEDGEETPRSRFAGARLRLLDDLIRLDPTDDDPSMVRDIHGRLLTALGYDRAGLIKKTEGPFTLVHASGVDTVGLAIVEAKPAEGPDDLLVKDAANLVEPFKIDDNANHDLHSVARLVSWLFLDDDHKPPFILVLAGPIALIAERERWPEGRYLVVDLQLIAERNDTKQAGEIDKALACLAADSLAPDADGNTWWTKTLEKSVQHTVGVSKDLREGVRLSIEIIANEVVNRRRDQGLDPLAAEEAQPLAKQSLRFLYRILFLLYAEASPELGVLPVGAPEYATGYSIDRLRELTLVELTTPKSQQGTHLYESLRVLFRLVDVGHAGAAETTSGREGLTFRSLRADLFKPEATSMIDEVTLGNAALQQVLQHLLLSKAEKSRKGRERGFISYAELGINQLGAVYEGLMSYTGRFAETDLYEVAKDGNAEKGSWLVPVDRADGIAAKDFVKRDDPDTGESKPVLHPQGDFVFRLAGRERQQSASYYTPEVLTRFTVGQALEELLDQDGHKTTAAEILDLTICEPALGSGAFAIEAVRQLAGEYLERRQAELGETIDPDDYPRELQKVKAHLALHNVYGVDLNATAVELAEISLWLDTMVAGLEAPWFGLHLRRGNSLIGARRAGFTRGVLENAKKPWLTTTPIPLHQNTADGVESRDDLVHHFLLPAAGWGAAAGVGKDIKALVPDQVKAVNDWRKSTKIKPGKKQIDALRDMADRVETLWGIATRRLQIAEQQARRDLRLWGREEIEPGAAYVTREQIETSLADPDSAYRRLKRVMDAWSALWFWPLTETEIAPPTLVQWYDALRRILGTNGSARRGPGKDQATFADVHDWDELGTAEHNDWTFAGAESMDRVVAAHPWLTVCERVADQQGFFHWELDFTHVFHGAGGFDLQVGNPPWVRPRTDVEALLAEADPWWQLKSKSTAAEDAAHREIALAIDGMRDLLVDGTTDIVCTADFVGSVQQYPHLVGLQPDLYRCFMERTWQHGRSTGSVGLIHLESHFTDEKAGLLRAETYRRLRRHWQFINELQLFEIQHQKRYGVNVYGAARTPSFRQAASLYHPDTVGASRRHDGSGPEPGIKDLDGNWDVRPHASRIVHVTTDTLASWHAVLETEDVPVDQTRMVYAVNQSTAAVLDKLASAPRLSALGLQFSPGWHEKNDRTKGHFEPEWGVPESWGQVILQGSHLGVARPLFKYPNPTMLHNTDWTEVDLQAVAPDEVPVTSYKPRGDRAKYDLSYTHWRSEPEGSVIAARDHYRLAWRNMAANTGERTFIPAVIPPGTAHIHGVSSVSLPDDPQSLAVAAGFAASLIHDFAVRSAPKSTISFSTLNRLPFVDDEDLRLLILLRTLRLNCVTRAYADLWTECFGAEFNLDGWTGGVAYDGRPALALVDEVWSAGIALRRAADRRQALLEIDVLVGMALGIEIEELCTIYRTQFPVLYGYDQRAQFYDANGQLVPPTVVNDWRRRMTMRSMSEPLRAVHPGSGLEYDFEPPFVVLDREADMRNAFAAFQGRIRDRRSNSA